MLYQKVASPPPSPVWCCNVFVRWIWDMPSSSLGAHSVLNYKLLKCKTSSEYSHILWIVYLPCYSWFESRMLSSRVKMSQLSVPSQARFPTTHLKIVSFLSKLPMVAIHLLAAKWQTSAAPPKAPQYSFECQGMEKMHDNGLCNFCGFFGQKFLNFYFGFCVVRFKLAFQQTTNALRAGRFSLLRFP